MSAVATWWRSLWLDERVAAVGWMAGIAWLSVIVWPMLMLVLLAGGLALAMAGTRRWLRRVGA